MQLVSLGNLDAHLPATASNDEISSLSKTFNGMIGEISSLLDEIKITQKEKANYDSRCFWLRLIRIFIQYLKFD